MGGLENVAHSRLCPLVLDKIITRKLSNDTFINMNTMCLNDTKLCALIQFPKINSFKVFYITILFQFKNNSFKLKELNQIKNTKKRFV